MDLRVLTGKYTGRSPQEELIVKEPTPSEHIIWRDVNQPVSEEVFETSTKK